MTKLTVNIDSRKSEKVILAVIKALGLSYEMESTETDAGQPLNKEEIAVFNRLKKSLEQIHLHQEGKIKLKTIEEVIAELS